jgi:hypothetical protein
VQLSNLKWYGTFLCLIGIALTSFNIYPLNILFGFVGSGLWTAAGYAQDDAPLVLVEAVATVLYAAGLIGFVAFEVSKWL